MSSNTTSNATRSSIVNSRSWRNPRASSLNSVSYFSTLGGNTLDGDRQKVSEDSVRTAKPYPLANEWTFYHDKYVQNATPEEYEENLKSVATVTTVQNFWEVYNNIIGPEQLQLRSSLHFMKNGIRPVWEDPRNENGGAWSFKVNKTSTATVWRELLMFLIGEQFEEYVAADDDVFGLSVSSRFNADIFTIWNKNSNAYEKAKVVEKLKETLDPIELQSPYYKAHREHAAFKKTDNPSSNINGRE